MKIAILGPGAMGCWLAAHLLATGDDVWLLDYRPERVAHLARTGIRMLHLDGAEISYPVNATADPAVIGPCDLAIMMVKTYHTRAAAAALPPLLAGGGAALTLQNGIGNLEGMAALVGREALLAGIVMAGVTALEWGRIRHAGTGAMILGLPAGSQVAPATLEQIAAHIAAAGLDCRTAPDIEAVLWDKLLVNAGINPVTALTRLPNGRLLDAPGAWEVVAAAVAEAAAVARDRGIAISPEPLARVRCVCEATAANRSSMLQDVLAGRPTEIDAINGQIVLHGEQVARPTPVNACLTQLIRALGQSPAAAS